VLRAPPARMYRAFLDPDAMAKWLPPNGFTGRVLRMGARVGGSYRMQFTHLGSGATHAFGGECVALVPAEHIVNTDRFDGPNLPGEMRTTVTFKAVSVGTELPVVQAGIPAVIPTDACYLGWQESLQLLAQWVEAEISGCNPLLPRLRTLSAASAALPGRGVCERLAQRTNARAEKLLKLFF
jgi:uncharacterized protein YndB with AHSA1/START domain